MPFPHDRGTMSLEQYLLRLLSALVIDNGGELRIKAQTVANIENLSALTRTRDRKRDEIVLRFGSPDTETYFLPSESVSPKRQDQQWQPSPMNSSNTSNQTIQGTLSRAQDENPQRPSRHVVLDDLNQFLKESQRNQQQEKLRQERINEMRFRSGDLPFRNFPEGRPPK